MQTPDLVLLYVKDVEKSTGLYRDLLKREPKAAFPTYIAFGLDGGFTLGLWSAKRAGEEWAKQMGLPVATVNLPPAECVIGSSWPSKWRMMRQSKRCIQTGGSVEYRSRKSP